MKERDEKIIARIDRKIDVAHLHKQARELKKLNRRAKLLILDLYEFRNMSTKALHSRSDFR